MAVTSARLADTHCHLDAYARSAEILHRADSAGVDLIAVTNSPEDFHRMQARLHGRRGAEAALGLHPESATSYQAGQRERFLRFLSRARWVGEVGLDYSSRWSVRERRMQRQNFELVTGTPLISGKPTSIHSRGATDDVIEILRDSSALPILHWYSGPTDRIERAVAVGCYFSVNPAMTRSRRARDLLREIPRDRMLLESDGPHARIDERPAEPSDMPLVVESIGLAWGLSPDEVSAQVRSNFWTLTAGGRQVRNRDVTSAG